MAESNLFDNQTELGVPEIVEIVGKGIPSYVNGLILRNGPAKFDLPSNFTMNNFYDGYTMLTRLEIKKGKFVSLTKKYLDSEAHRKAIGAGKPCVLEFCTRSYADPEKSILFRHLPDVLPVFSDNGNTGIYKLGNRVFTCAETCNFQHVDTDLLTTIDRYDTNVTYGLALTSAHPLTDPDTGLVYNIGPSMLTGLKYHMVRIDPKTPKSAELDQIFKESQVFGGVPSSSLTKFSYTHSFGMSENYLIILEQPFQTSVPKVIGGVLRSCSIFDFNKWNKNFKNRFHIVSKSTGKVFSSVEIRAETPFFFFHFINCFELKKCEEVSQGSQVTHLVIDILTYPTADIIQTGMISNLRAGNQLPNSSAQAQRFVIPMLESLTGVPEQENLNDGLKQSGKAVRNGKTIFLVPENLAMTGIEFPSINQKYIGKPYKYFYATSFIDKLGSYPNSIVKVNTVTNEVIRYREEKGVVISEGIFIPNPEGKSEDDGTLVATVSKSGNVQQPDGDYLLFLDAKNIEEIGRATFKASLPLGCHGLFLAKDQPSKSGIEI